MTIKNSAQAMGMAVHGTHSLNKRAESKNRGSQRPFYNTKPPLPSAGELLYDSNILNVLREYFPNFKKLGAVFQGRHSSRVNIYRHNGLYLVKDFTGKEFGYDTSRNTLQVIEHYHQCDFKEALAILLEKLGYTATRQQAPLRQRAAPGTNATVRQEPDTVQVQVNVQQWERVTQDTRSNFHHYARKLGVPDEHLKKWHVGTETRGTTVFTVFGHQDCAGAYVNLKYFIFRVNWVTADTITAIVNQNRHEAIKLSKDKAMQIFGILFETDMVVVKENGRAVKYFGIVADNTQAPQVYRAAA